MQSVDGAASPSNTEPVIIYKGNLSHPLIGQYFTFFRFHIHAPTVTASSQSSKLTDLNDYHIIQKMHKIDQNVM